MPTSLDVDQFLAAPGPMLDVRSPGEYAQAHIPGAVSFPLFSDEERARVGICYKHDGRDAAVELGFAIAGPKCADFIHQAREIGLAQGWGSERWVRVHCWRGGMRSEGVSWILEMAGFRVALLRGGYKTFRGWALSQFERPHPILILGGMTGCGKTAILHALAHQGEQIIDLEALAHHRGSSYGNLSLPPQPSNEQFENRLAIAWSRLHPDRPVWLEAESKRIGLCRIPEPLFQQMEGSPVLEVERSRQERLALLVNQYGQATTDELVTATERIRKRLGGLCTQQAVDFIRQGNLVAACDIILSYYDKTYTYDLHRRPVSIYPVPAVGLSDGESATLLQHTVQALALAPALLSGKAQGVSSIPR